jgi:DNA-binding transcriptional regulator YhcF (GntR family)
VSVVASSQEPIDIPLMAYGMATHLFLFKNNDLRRAQRMAELTGVNREVAQYTILQLPEHEFVYINKKSGAMLRSKVIRRAGA